MLATRNFRLYRKRRFLPYVFVYPPERYRMVFKKKVTHDFEHFTRNDMDTKTITLFPCVYSCSCLLFYDSTRVDGRRTIRGKYIKTTAPSWRNLAKRRVGNKGKASVPWCCGELEDIKEQGETKTEEKHRKCFPASPVLQLPASKDEVIES